jgi:hypothetical protein|uniref:Uncharacterized protein n=1 Tax=viral metagenome TaxID=1070528 RepID=A0A6C0EV99_9ZZZZ
MKNKINKNQIVIRNVMLILLFIFVGLFGFSFYTYKTLESHVDYSNCVSYIPYLDTSLKNNY